MTDSQSPEDSQIAHEEDTIKILLATDCHLGYEHSTKRLQDNDSLITFEEILELALKHDVDFILLGGDLFHDSKPTQKVVLQCMELLKKYTLGDREINIQLLSNPEVIFAHTSQKTVNYEDPNLNVAMPIFSIHGNHDNPSFQSTGTMDLFGASGFINYFGKWSDLTNVTVPPLVFNKGKTYVSIYGLSYMNDQRLSRLLRDNKVTLLRPSGICDPFNLLVLHQNRAKHTVNGYIPENKLPGFLDLVFWGHEHQCRIKPELIVNESTDPPTRYYITQPGSSVATSLCEGEATEKHIGLLKIHKKLFHIEPIKLETVRPFVFDSICLQDVDLKQNYNQSLADFVFDYVDNYIENELIPRAGLLVTGHPRQPTIPLIRLRVFYTMDSELFDTMKISRKYCDRVANPRDMILFRKQRVATGEQEMGNVLDGDELDEGDISDFFRQDADDVDWNKTVQGSIRKYFEQEAKKDSLTVLSVEGLNEALKRFVEAADDDAFEDVVNHQCKKNMQYMKKYDVHEESEIIEQLKVYRDERSNTEKTEDERRDVQNLLNDKSRKSRKKLTQPRMAPMANTNSDESNEEDANDEKRSATRGGRGARSRGATTTRATRGKGRGTKNPPVVAISSKKTSSIFGDISSGNTSRINTTVGRKNDPIFVPDSDSD